MLSKLKPYWPSLFIVPAVLILFWPALLDPALVLFPSFSPFSDIMVIHWPKARLMAQNWQAGAGLPYWTPLILSGMPLAANQLAMLAYPLAWLFLVLPIEPVFNGLFIFHLIWGGFGIYLLLHERFAVSPLAALLGGLTFALNGKGLAHLAGGHVSMVAAISWLPWVVLGIQMWLQHREAGQQASGGPGRDFRFSLISQWPGAKWTILSAVSLAMQVVTHTLPLLYGVYLAGAMLAWQAARTPDPISPDCRYLSRFLPSLALLVVILLLASLLSAAQLLPLLELAQFGNRSFSLSEATAFALSPLQLGMGLLLPSVQAGHESIVYAGLVPLLLAPLGLSRKQPWSWFYALVFIFAVLFALGPHNPLHTLFYYAAPGFRWVRTPARIFFAGGLALAVLVGFGADRLVHTAWSPLAKKWLARFTLALGALALLLGFGLVLSLGQSSPVFRSALALAMFVPLGLVIILLRAHQKLSARITMSLLGLLLFWDLAWFDTSLLRFVPLDTALAPGRAAAAYLAQKPDYFRVYSPSYSLPMQTAAAAGLALADGVEPVHLRVYDQFMAQAGGYNDARFSVTIPKFGPGPVETSLQAVEPNLKLLGLLNVTYLVSAFPMAWQGLSLETEVEGTFIYRNSQALPRAWVAHQALPVEENWLEQLKTLPDGVVLVERAPPNPSGASNGQLSTVKISAYAPNQIGLETVITQPGWLVLSEIWYPGWRATVNGVSQPVEKVNGLLRGVSLNQPGAYQIELIYQPTSIVWGQWISGISLLVLVLGSGLLYGMARHHSTGER